VAAACHPTVAASTKDDAVAVAAAATAEAMKHVLVRMIVNSAGNVDVIICGAAPPAKGCEKVAVSPT